MNILFLSRRFYPQVGGVERHVMKISELLAQQGHSIIIISEGLKDQKNTRKIVVKQQRLAKDKRDSALAKEQQDLTKTEKEVPHNHVQDSLYASRSIVIYRMPEIKEGKQKKLFIWQWMWRYRNLILQADIVHAHDVFFWYLPFRFLFFRKPIFTTFHGYESYPIKKKAVVIRKMSEMLSIGNICIGDFISKWYGTKPTFVSYGAVEMPESKNKISNIKKESAVFFGRLDEQTGILTYVEAFKVLKRRVLNFKLLVIGDGIYRKSISRFITIIPFQQNLEKYFEKYHFVFVSRYLSILEAFAAKKLVFAVYDNPLKEDYLRMAPFARFIIIEKDPQKLAEKILYYLHNPDEEKKIVSEAYKWVKKQSWEEMVSVYKKLWKKKMRFSIIT